MIRSMTGYGRGRSIGKVNWEVEIKSVNHRFLEIYIRLPKPWLFLEERIRSFIKERIARGRIDVFINYSSETLPVDIKIDKKAVESYYKKLAELREEIGFEGPVSLSLLSMMPDLFKVEQQFPEEEEMWSSLKGALQEAVDGLIQMRTREGVNLWRDISSRLDIIQKRVENIKLRADAVVEEYRKKLRQKIERISQGELNEERLETEVVFFAERSDINEELVRIESHIAQLRGMPESKDLSGKKMDFIAQELFREVNTIAAKSSDYKIAQEVIEIKSELEKIREQLQNIE
ncbi:YicC/YloC family endoribonuclease [Thermosediminibacter oceani]|uniref:YicC domain protein n=1 Tax=Thermosediminibacter oceani (strain ATCC BAA-1034 / DSM 16646 / JW/IW-1228P) TaxID=555079 RepID=D9S305_THEOJ|nr:YicC/YloC family endoribonuclease [Thermosediminibacter oceani]ADL07782.1 YicC domain protein [Thermosediminibacter oceani DSM 16646]